MSVEIPVAWTPTLDMVGTWVAVILTLFVFSYLLGDNLLFRLAEHIFVGVAVGYAAVVVLHDVLLPKLLAPMVGAVGTGDWIGVSQLAIPLAFGLLLWTKSFKWTRSISWWGSFSVALLLGVGAAVAIGGALWGTLLPQATAAADISRYVERYGLALGLFSGIVALLGTTGVLLHFHFNTSPEGTQASLRHGLVRSWGGLGRWYLLLAFGALLASTFISRLSFLIGRVLFLLDAVRGLVGG
jgi:hypothetical protein